MCVFTFALAVLAVALGLVLVLAVLGLILAIDPRLRRVKLDAGWRRLSLDLERDPQDGKQRPELPPSSPSS